MTKKIKKVSVKNKESNTGKLAVFGAGLASVAATAYFFLGPKSKEHIENTKIWATKMKKDVIKKLKIARKMSEPAYNKIIDAVATEYEQKKNTGRKEIQSLAKDLKKHWKVISRNNAKK